MYNDKENYNQLPGKMSEGASGVTFSTSPCSCRRVLATMEVENILTNHQIKITSMIKSKK